MLDPPLDRADRKAMGFWLVVAFLVGLLIGIGLIA